MEAPFLPAGISVSGSWTNGDETVTATSPSPSTTVVLVAAFVCRVFATGQAGRRPVAVPSPTGTRGWGGGRVSVRRVSLSHGVAEAQRASRRGVSEPPAVRPHRSVTQGSLPPLHRRRTWGSPEEGECIPRATAVAGGTNRCSAPRLVDWKALEVTDFRSHAAAAHCSLRLIGKARLGGCRV